MFDKLAADGLGVPHLRSIERSERFYRVLADRDFSEISALGNQALAAYPTSNLFAERVLDKQMMMKSFTHQKLEGLVGELRDYLDGYPNGYRMQTIAAADAIVSALGVDPLRLSVPVGCRSALNGRR